MKPITIAQIGGLALLALLGVMATAEPEPVSCPTLSVDQSCDL